MEKALLNCLPDEELLKLAEENEKTCCAPKEASEVITEEELLDKDERFLPSPNRNLFITEEDYLVKLEADERNDSEYIVKRYT